MAFTLDDHWVWDFWLADDGEDFHMFYLHAPKSLGDPDLRHRNARFGHATSRNLSEWVDLGPIFTPGRPGDFDETATWTGSVLQGPDGLWRMFYTGSRFINADANTNIETIGVATSSDLYTWTKHPGPLTRADPRWYETLGTSTWPEEAWRDPWVFAGPDGDGWHMLVTARANHGPDDDRGVIGHATSPDLENWEVQAPLSSPGAGFAHLEVPQIAEIDGAGVLLFSCDTPKLAASRRGRGEGGGIWCVASPDLAGPYEVKEASLLASESLYGGRIIKDRHGRWMVLAFDMSSAEDDFVGSVSDPISVSWTSDTRTLQLLPSPALEEVKA